MTTNSTSTVVDHTGDVPFRAWGSEVAAMLAAVGMVQTADTGQINWVTVTRPGVSTAAGYEIWRYADSTYYLKIEYGTGTGATSPQMWATWGTGSNGTGTITGQTSTRSTFTANAAPTSTVTAYTSRTCHVANAFSFSWKETFAGAATNAGAHVHGKTVDGNGNAITTGFAVIRNMTAALAGQISKQCVRVVATAATFNDVSTDILVPGDPNTSSTASTGFQQAYQIPMNVPDVLPFNWAASALLTELPRGSTMLVAMVGVTTHTYIATGGQSAQTYGQYTAGRYGLAMIWE